MEELHPCRNSPEATGPVVFKGNIQGRFKAPENGEAGRLRKGAVRCMPLDFLNDGIPVNLLFDDFLAEFGLRFAGWALGQDARDQAHFLHLPELAGDHVSGPAFQHLGEF